MDAKAFAKVRELVGTQAEMQAGVGDEAFFWGNVASMFVWARRR